ncbi:MAG: outer membrane beta-barrel protein [Chthoniobacterales bacterium]|nr:outer membrane beta-barrel protein [Chthoniobacterales bacterium]
MKKWCVFCLALLLIQTLPAQTEPDQPVDSTLGIETSGEPIVQINPSDGTPIAATENVTGEFTLGRRIQLSGSVLAGYNDNVNRTSTGSGSMYGNANAAFSYTFGTPRTHISLLTGGALTYYFDRPGFDPNIHVRFGVDYRATPRLTLDLKSSLSYQSRPDLSTSLSTSNRLGNFFRSSDRLAIDYKWTPRISTVSSYALSILQYESSAGSFANRQEHTFGESLHFLWFPTTTAVGEYRFSLQSYEQSGRDSTNQSVLAGVDQTFTQYFGGSLRAGVQFRSGDRGDRTSPHVESTLHYKFATRGSVVWTNNYSIQESDVPGATGRTTFRTNLNLNYGFTPRISASLTLSYALRDQAGSDGSNVFGGSSSDTTLDIGPSIHYAVSRHVGLSAGYRHTAVDRGGSASGGASESSLFRSYTRNTYFVGLNLRF